MILAKDRSSSSRRVLNVLDFLLIVLPATFSSSDNLCFSLSTIGSAIPSFASRISRTNSNSSIASSRLLYIHTKRNQSYEENNSTLVCMNTIYGNSIPCIETLCQVVYALKMRWKDQIQTCQEHHRSLQDCYRHLEYLDGAIHTLSLEYS